MNRGANIFDFLQTRDIRKSHPLLRVQPKTVKCVDDRIASSRLPLITWRKVDEDIAIRGVPFQIPFQRFRVHRNAFQLALEFLLQVRKRLDQVVAIPAAARRVVL